MALHLGQVEVWSPSTLDELFRVVEEVQTKIEQACGNGLAVDCEVLLYQMPATRTCDQCGQDSVCPELIVLLALLEIDLAANGIV